MKRTKYFKVNPSSRRSWESRLWSLKRGLWKNLYYNVGLVILAGILALLIMIRRENAGGSTSMTEYLHRLIFTTEQVKIPPQWNWNYSSFSFEPNVSDWDEERGILMKEHKELWPEWGARPRVMMVTGSSPGPCEPSILSHLLLRSTKNKLDYCRMHDMELYYNMGEPDPDFSDWWVKLPVIRMLMLQHPELEWIWWLDADAILTDMSFEPPFVELEYHNLVLYGDHQLVYHLKDWKSVSTANFMIRNCQWSLNLLDAWGSMGTAKMRAESGRFQSEVLAYRPSDFPGDDQSSMVALLTQDQRNPHTEQKWVPSVKLVMETEYVMNGNWRIVGPLLEDLTLDTFQRVPFVTHFTGCLPACTGKPNWLPREVLDVCAEQLERAIDFADNQVYQRYGFQPRTLGRSLEPLIKSPRETLETYEDTERAEVSKEFSLPPKLTDWDERRKIWMEEDPSTKRDEVLLVSGSAPKPCASKAGGQILLRGIKNRIDYARLNGISKVFYNMAVIDKDLIGWWSKLPLLKMLMLSNPNVEWIWWMDSDAAFTDMEFKLPFSRYNASGYNLVMYGSEQELFDKKSYIGINTGNLLLRNCQWSLDLLDRWASFGATEELRVKNEDLLNNLLSDRTPGWDADDQSVLAYILITERKKWESQVCLETSFAMSGWWQQFTVLFGDDVEWTHLETKPFVTHFAGCHPCKEDAEKTCLVGMDKTYNFADNQVLKRYGLRHVHINSSALLRTSQLFSDLQLEDELDIEGFEAKEELEAAMKEVVQTAKNEQTSEGEFAETKDKLGTDEDVPEEEFVAAKEDDENTGSTKELDSGSTEFDPASENELGQATRDEETNKAVSKEQDLDKALQEEKSDAALEEESDSASKEDEALNKGLDEEVFNPDSEEVESYKSNAEESASSNMEDNLTNANQEESYEKPDMEEDLTKADKEEEEWDRTHEKEKMENSEGKTSSGEELEAFWSQAKEELQGSTEAETGTANDV